MERRRFLGYLVGLPVGVYAVSLLGACADDESLSAAKAEGHATGKFQTYAYYEPLGETDAHDPRETDGTTYDMPCLTADEIAAGLEKTFDFWHGHNGVQHKFKVTTDDFAKLKAGHEVLVYTDMVDDHRHPLLLSPTRRCESKAC